MQIFMMITISMCFLSNLTILNQSQLKSITKILHLSHEDLLVAMPARQAAMLTTRLHFMVTFHAVLLISTTIVSANKIETPIPKPKSLIAKLIHLDSIPSQSAIRGSTSDPQISFITNDDIEANLLARPRVPFLFFVNFSIGQPPVPQLSIMDTGSSLVWVKCYPYAKLPQEDLYYPDKSSTYTPMSCQKNHCDTNCNSLDQCTYSIHYVSGTPSKGIYAFEQLTFETSDGGKTVVPNVTFGCSQEHENNTDKQFSGVFGLGSQSSLVKQLGSKFSYCIGSATDPAYNYNKLYLGDAAMMEGYSTPFKKRKTEYYVILEGISLGDKKIDIDPRAFEERPESKYENGVTIDSGSLYTWLADEGYEPLEIEVKQLVDAMLPRYYDRSVFLTTRRWSLCYNGTVEENLQGFPATTFHLADGADLVLDSSSMFHQVSPTGFCLAVGPGSALDEDMRSFSTIGIMAQQNYNVGYDLNENRLYFQRIDCELLED